jgi:hypothetical protein
LLPPEAAVYPEDGLVLLTVQVFDWLVDQPVDPPIPVPKSVLYSGDCALIFIEQVIENATNRSMKKYRGKILKVDVVFFIRWILYHVVIKKKTRGLLMKGGSNGPGFYD